jgi:putative transposase
MAKQMREITGTAAAATRKARRDTERRSAMPARPGPAARVPPPPPPGTAGVEAEPFEVIEQW